MSVLIYQSVQVGDEIPAFTTAPISRTTLALYAGASGDHNPIHIDIDFAKKFGMDDVFVHGMLNMAYLGRLLTDWVPQSAIRHYGVRFASITAVKDRICCSGKIVEKYEKNGEQLIRLEVTAANQGGDIKLSGQAVIALP
ncbi:MAG: MaoC family dehydratase [Desulfuromonadales bacterium]|nr:MaoC family dehydratase [Desulfuromonadales bacterium]